MLWAASVVIVLFALFFLLVIRSIRRSQGVLHKQLAAYRRADYRAQLQEIEHFRVGNSEPAHYLFFRGVGCFELGQLKEAEESLRRSLAMEHRCGQRILCLDQLGRVLMEQDRYDEAEALFRDSISEGPHRGGGHRSMAELLLRRGECDSKALEEARAATAADRAAPVHPSDLGSETHKLNVGESLAVYAWALARNGGTRADVEETIMEALAIGPSAAKPVLSEIHYFAGQAYAALDDTVESSRHFRCATDIDPDGNYGRLSRGMQAGG
jgi:tetratricopeptide (TPR) repeat protein